MTDTTPLPWKVSEGSDQYIGNGDSWIASTMGIRGEQGAANARYIVQAANAHPRLVEALREARTELSITRTNIMCEINRCADPRDSRWEGVPEILKERIAKIDAALSEVEAGQ